MGAKMSAQQVAATSAAIDRFIEIPSTQERILEELVAVRAELAEIRRRLPTTLITITEASERLRVTRKTIRRWIDRGLLKAIRVGDRRRIDLASVIPELRDAQPDPQDRR